MSNQLWLQRWEEKNIGWHEKGVNQFLENYFHLLNLEKDSTIFLPLCGKTRDISWLLNHGYNVVGCELSGVAISELFEELGKVPKISIVDNFKVYSSHGITIFEGDIFNLTKELVGKINAIYDRAALVALPLELRTQYTALLQNITNNAKQLLITVLYEQELHNRTPYSISKEEIGLHYQKCYTITKIDSALMDGGLKGICEAKDEVWLIS